MDYNKNWFFAAWLGLGLFQVFLFSGCSGNSMSDQLLSSGPAASPANAGNPSDRTATSNDSPPIIPLRMSREFFNSSLAGQIQIQGVAAQPSPVYNSSISWKLLPPTGPAPAPGYIADFRDQPGCASYDEINGASVCFDIAPDVSSVALTADKIQLDKVQPLVEQYVTSQQPAGCDTSVSALQFESASRDDTNSLTLTYAGTVQKQEDRCTGGPIKVRLSLQKM